MFPCFAAVMSPGKCLSVIPYWPIFAIVMLACGATFLLLGAEQFYKALGIHVEEAVISATQAATIVLILLDLLFAYSVCSNKLRIHNVHCMAEACRGYRIKDAETWGSAALRACCKMYNIVLLTLNWIGFVIALVLSAICTFSGTVALSLVALCEISKDQNATLTNGTTVPASGEYTYVAIDELIDRLRELQNDLDSTPISGYITVTDKTTSELVCSNNDQLTRGAIFLAGGGLVALVAQVIMLVSYNVVAEVSWRHMKDVRKEGERMEDMTDADEIRRMQVNSVRGLTVPKAAPSSPGNYPRFDVGRPSHAIDDGNGIDYPPPSGNPTSGAFGYPAQTPFNHQRSFGALNTAQSTSL